MKAMLCTRSDAPPIALLRPVGWLRTGLWAVVLSAAGCAQWVRQDAQNLVNAGDYEQALQLIRDGSEKFPHDQLLLRSTQTRLDDEISSRLNQQLSDLRSEGRLDEARAVLDRAKKLGLKNIKLDALYQSIQLDQQAQEKIQQAQQLAQSGETGKALALIQQGLQDSPSHRGLQVWAARLNTMWRQQTGLGGLTQLKEGPSVTLELRQAPLSAALEILSKSAGIEFILDRDVRQQLPVTIYMKQARLSDALDLVLSAQGLARRVVDQRTVLIYPNTPEKRKEHQDVVIKVFQLAHAEAKTIANMLRATLKTSEPFVDERANLITVRDSADAIALAERLVQLHDTPEPEVMLQVEILEVSRTRMMNLGINFPTGATFTPLTSAGASTGLTINDLQNINAARIGTSSTPLTLNLRRELGDSQVLANPSIRTKNREKAKILIGDKVPVVTTSSTATGIVGQSITYLEVGLKLEVEPQITPDDEVNLKMALEVSSITKQIDTGNGGTAYQIGTRNAATTLRLQNGETQLLGGLINKSETTNSVRVPGLGDIPVLGLLFGNRNDNNSQTELVLSITPRVIKPALRTDLSQSWVGMGTENMPRLKLPLLATTSLIKNPEQAALPPSIESLAATRAQGQPTVPSADPSSPPGQLHAKWTVPNPPNLEEVFIVRMELLGRKDLKSLAVEMQIPESGLEVKDIRLSESLSKDKGMQLIHAVNKAQGKASAYIQKNDSAEGFGQGSALELVLHAKKAGKHPIKINFFSPIGIHGPIQSPKSLPELELNISEKGPVPSTPKE